MFYFQQVSFLIIFVLVRISFGSDKDKKTQGLVSSTPKTSEAFKEIDVDTLLKAINIPTCESNCTTNLLTKLYEMVEMENIFDKWKDLCGEYNKSTVCMETPHHCSHGEIYRILTSGVSNLCFRKEKYFDRNKDCIKPTLDTAAKECDASCNMIQSIGDLSHSSEIKKAAESGGNVVTVLIELGGVCKAANCFLPCFREKMNFKCERSGGMIVDGILKPFYVLVKFLESATPMIKEFVSQKVPKSCSYLIQRGSLDSLRQSKN